MKHGYNKHTFKEFSLTAKFMPMMTFLLSLKMYYIMKKINIVDKETEYHVKSLTRVSSVCNDQALSVFFIQLPILTIKRERIGIRQVHCLLVWCDMLSK